MSNGLFAAVTEGRMQQLKFLLDSGLSVNRKNKEGQSVLLAALQIQDPRRRDNMFKYLVSHKAELNPHDASTGRDLLTWAVFLDRTDIAKYLLQQLKGAVRYHNRDYLGRTVLHYAVLRGNVELVRLICEQMRNLKLSVDVASDEGFTPYLMAKRLGFDECVQILERIGGACHLQFDDKDHIQSHEWTSEGQREKRKLLKNENQRRTTVYKVLGRLPQLKAAEFETPRVRIVKSKLDRKLLNSLDFMDPSADRSITDFGRTALRNELKPLDSSRDKSNPRRERRHMFTVATDRPTRELALKLINMQAGVETESVMDDDAFSTARYSESVAPSSHHEVGSMRDSIVDMMTILEQQCSGSYRQCVRKELLQMPTGKKGRKSRLHDHPGTSTMAIIFGQDGKKTVVKKGAKDELSELKKHKKALSMIKEGSTSVSRNSHRPRITGH